MSRLAVTAGWLALTALLATVLWMALGGFETDALAWIVLLAATVSAGFVAGVVCWTRGHRIIGIVGLVAPAAPIVGHVLALLYGPEESWAPTIVGDLLGLAAALVFSFVAVVAALVTGRERVPKGIDPTILLVIGFVAAGLAGCGDGDDSATDTVPETAAQTTTETAAPTGGDGSATVASVVAAAQELLDAGFAAQPDPPPGVLGAIELACDRTGEVGAGDLLACAGTPRTEPGFELDGVGVLFAVLDDAGTAAWATGTDLPSDDRGLGRLIETAPSGLFCRDLVDPELQAETGFFGATTTTASFGYFLSVVYWFAEGRPDRMDADGNGIPCETVHDPDVVAAIWSGGPIP